MTDGTRRVALLVIVGWLASVRCAVAAAHLPVHPASADSARQRGAPSGIRFVRYEPDRVYQLRGYVGYEIDLQFAPNERFVGLGVGDAKAIKVASAENHVFIKPLVRRVSTDMTVITNRRTYVFRYRVGLGKRDAHPHRIVYAVRFVYSGAQRRHRAAERRRLAVDRDLRVAERAPPRNENYWYCGSKALKPTAAWDDGVETHLVFAADQPIPAVFVLNADGSESLVNFDMRGPQMVIHRVAHRFVLKRGRLHGCIVNKGFEGSGRRLRSGTLSSQVWRVTREARRGRGVSGAGGMR